MRRGPPAGITKTVTSTHEHLHEPDPAAGVADLDDVEQIAALLPGPGLSFRGGGADWWEEGRTYTEPGWLRSSRDPRVATENFATGDPVALFGAGGRDVESLSDHPDEQETVFLPGSRFTVLRRAEADGLTLWVVRVHPEGDDGEGAEASDADVADAVTRAVNALVRARTLPPVPVERAGRFVGGFGRRH